MSLKYSFFLSMNLCIYHLFIYLDLFEKSIENKNMTC